MSGGEIMVIRKIFRAGNSQVVALTKEILQKLHLKEGSPVVLELDEEKKYIVLKPLDMNQENVTVNIESIDNDYINIVNNFIKKYEQALKELAK